MWYIVRCPNLLVSEDAGVEYLTDVTDNSETVNMTSESYSETYLKVIAV